MWNLNSSQEAYLSPIKRRNYLIGISACIIIILITFCVPIFSIYGQGISLFGMLGLASDLKSIGAYLGAGDLGSAYLGAIFPIVFLPAVLIAIISYLNLIIKSKGYSVFSFVLSACGAVYTIIIMKALTSIGVEAKLVPFILQILCYIIMSVITYMIITKTYMEQSRIHSNCSEYLYDEDNIYDEDVESYGNNQKKAFKKKNVTAFYYEEGNKMSNMKNKKTSKLEAENHRIKKLIKNIKKDIGEYMYNAGVSDEDIEKYIAEIDANYAAIGKNKEKILEKDGKKVCEKCGNISKSESNFCNECGKKYEDDKEKCSEHYKKLSKEKVDISKMNGEIKELLEDNEKKLAQIEKQLVKIGEKVYHSIGEFDEEVEKRRNDISALEMKKDENQRAYLKEKGLKLCPNCGNEIDKNAKYCDNCGIKVSEEKEK